MLINKESRLTQLRARRSFVDKPVNSVWITVSRLSLIHILSSLLIKRVKIKKVPTPAINQDRDFSR